MATERPDNLTDDQRLLRAVDDLTHVVRIAALVLLLIAAGVVTVNVTASR